MIFYNLYIIGDASRLVVWLVQSDFFGDLLTWICIIHPLKHLKILQFGPRGIAILTLQMLTMSILLIHRIRFRKLKAHFPKNACTVVATVSIML